MRNLAIWPQSILQWNKLETWNLTKWDETLILWVKNLVLSHIIIFLIVTGLDFKKMIRYFLEALDQWNYNINYTDCKWFELLKNFD